MCMCVYNSYTNNPFKDYSEIINLSLIIFCVYQNLFFTI